jgi:hypothetical protein
VFFTAADLERELAKAIVIWTADMRFKSPTDRGAVPVPISVFIGHIPSFQSGPTAVQQTPKAPSIAVKVSSGHYRRMDGDATINMAILTWDDAIERTGYTDVLNIINRLSNGMLENIVLSNAFILLQDTVGEESITFELIEDPNIDFHPYNLGMVTAKYGLMSPGPDDAPYNFDATPPFGDDEVP